jgi:hypothetical protein
MSTESKTISIPLNTGEMMVNRDKRGRITAGSVLNPNGKPKGTRHLSTILSECLSRSTNDESTHEDIIINKVIEMAENGDMRAIELVWDRLEGKATQTIHQKNDGEVLSEDKKKKLMALLEV